MKTYLKGFLSVTTLFVLLLAVTVPALAQAELTLRVSKVFGYNAGKNIRGTFSLNVIGPDNVSSVAFLIDGQEIGRVDQAPFEMKIKTGDFPSGDHLLQARATLAGGSTLESAERAFRFLTPDEEASGMTKIIFPLLGVVALITVAGFAFQILSARGRGDVLQTPGAFTYRSGPGAICPRCQLPTPVHMTGLNVGIMTKFDRCENCGKWGLLRVRSAREMEAYARSLIAKDQERVQVQPETEEEKLRRQMDDSRYSD